MLCERKMEVMGRKVGVVEKINVAVKYTSDLIVREIILARCTFTGLFSAELPRIRALVIEYLL